MQRVVEWCLPCIFVLALVGVVLANPDPLARDALCNATLICFRSASSAFWNNLIYEFGLGGSVSVVFYWLLVKLPDISKRKRLRRYLNESYINFRREATMQFLWASGMHGVDLDFCDSISSQKSFREYFKRENADLDGDKWHDVQNNITQYQLEYLAVTTKSLRDDVAYVLNNIDVADQKAFEMLHRLTKAIAWRKFTSTDYDDQKSLFAFYWEIMAGWSAVRGYADHDAVERIIRKI